MKKTACLHLCFLILVVTPLLYPAPLSGTGVEEVTIVEYRIEGETPRMEVGEVLSVYMRAESDVGVEEIGFEVNDRHFSHSCHGEKSCEFLWQARIYVMGKYDVILFAVDTLGNTDVVAEKVVVNPVHVPDFVPSATDNGRLEQKDGIWVLSLWGTPYDMGYAHGFLLAPQIKRALESLVVSIRIGGEYDRIVEQYGDKFLFNQDQLDEMQGILDGMSDSGIDMSINDREIGVNDLKLINHLNEWGDLGCTTITVYGDQTRGGATLTSRGLDSPIRTAVGSTQVACTIITAYAPEGKNRFLTVSYPGLIGCVTALNEDGYAVFINNGPERVIQYDAPYDISLLSMRELMETVSINDPVQWIDVLFDYKNPLGGSIITVARGSVIGSGEKVGGLEFDSAGHVLRVNGDMGEAGDYFIVPNEHFKLVDNPKSIRYLGVEAVLRHLGTSGDKMVDREELRRIFLLPGLLGRSKSQQHVMILDLDGMEFDFYLGEFQGLDFIPASAAEKHRFSWDEFFPNP